MAKATHVKVVKTLLLIILLVIFFFLFFLQVVMQYSEKFTNTAKIEQNAESIEMQTISICTGFRESVMKKYGITTQIFFLPPDQDSNLPSNATVRSLFDDITFKMNREFVIALSGSIGFDKPVPLMIGTNEIKVENTTYIFEVMEVPTTIYGVCYIIIPQQVFMIPYRDMLTLSIARNITTKNEEMRKLFIQISSDSTFNTLGKSLLELWVTTLLPD